MRRVADGVYLLLGHPHYYINAYLMNDIVVDTATRFARGRILRQLEGKKVRMVALTHCHPDHQGCVQAICERYRVPLACHELDVPAMEGRAPMIPGKPLIDVTPLFSGPPRAVDRVLRDGDELSGFRVVHAPGHTPGHVMFFRSTDRLLIAGDILANINWLTGRARLIEPPPFFSADPAQNRRSMKLVLDLQPNLICFGHGPPLHDMDRLRAFIEPRLRRR